MELADDKIIGYWDHVPRYFFIDKQPTLIEQFANWPDEPQKILQFTKRFGPLYLPATGDEQFEFSLSEWLAHQREFRARWEEYMRKPGPIRLIDYEELEADLGERFTFVFSDLSYRVSTLFRMLVLDLYSRPRNRIRKCALAECQNPYFFATHLRQGYCSEPCVAIAQKEIKREWWKREGSEERRRRRLRSNGDTKK